MAADLQKASIWKRISAYMFDVILTVCLALAVAIGVSFIFKYDAQFEKITDVQQRLEQEYDITFDITEKEYNALPEDKKAAYDAANEAFLKDPVMIEASKKILGMMIANVAISLLVADIVVYLVFPLIFKNGQTLGKKLFGLAVMRTNCVKITPPVLFVRSMIGLYIMETMVPLFIAAMMSLGFLGIVGTITLVLLLALEIGVMIATKTNSSIHDLLTDTVVVDFSSQQIFDSLEARTEYEKAEAARLAAEADRENEPIAIGAFAPRSATTSPANVLENESTMELPTDADSQTDKPEENV